eukprot:CAMPEP_0170539290 /NCGR_PEP_ID=MMETSP0209-20121228/103834_1 /TAXON_ID=665100 ORGANISM="Litonotus pictus, Strain P1" /NCGR_SAMPLE_ID=MMETSP0209 /ASSEMBLY_ACC=CAM_ASM_000301 /LENGTH=238 /DNA_ID=CAMNT_0010841175 /DNA_START=470 /DNA_END=1183 /DNA_ORIENTATION=-
MLLSDSIGGTSKTLMIACVSPSMEWSEETLSTLNYASKTKNISNKPVVQVQDSEKEYFEVKKENDLLKKENEILKTELIKLTGNYEEDQEEVDTEFFFPELVNEINQQKETKDKLSKANDQSNKKIIRLEEENKGLSSKLNNLELVLIGPTKIQELNQAKLSATSENNLYNLTQENNQLRERMNKLEIKKNELKVEVSKLENPGNIMRQNDEELTLLTEQNRKLVNKVEFLQKREREL